MSTGSGVEWTDDTDNIIVVEGGGHWCRKKNKLCALCYAETLNQNSFFGGNKLAYSGQPPPLKLRREMIAAWARQRKPRKHFVASMTDVFGEWVDRAWQFEFLDGMLAAPLQTFQVLTKRYDVMLRAVKLWMAARGIETPPANIWLGYSAGDQETFDEGWPAMRELAAMGFTIFISCEPLLGPITLPDDFLALGLRAQIIAGGESGKKKQKVRPMHPDWPRGLRDQCVAAGVPFFFKQWGEHIDVDTAIKRHGFNPYAAHAPFTRIDGYALPFLRVGKKKTGRLLDGREWSQFPQAKGAAA